MSLRRSHYYTAPVPKMPLGLVELMDGLARDVLINNPDNIYDFCANHMHKLIEMRDGHAPQLFMKLDKKIAKAQDIVKKRAQQRRHAYDKDLHSTNYAENESNLIVSDIRQPDNILLLNVTNTIQEKGGTINDDHKDIIDNQIETVAEIQDDTGNNISKLNSTLAGIDIKHNEEKVQNNSQSDKQGNELNKYNDEKEIIKLEINAVTNNKVHDNLNILDDQTKMTQDNTLVSRNVDEYSINTLNHLNTPSEFVSKLEDIDKSETEIINLEKSDNSYVHNETAEESKIENNVIGTTHEIDDSKIKSEYEKSSQIISSADQVNIDNHMIIQEEQDEATNLSKLIDDENVTDDYLVKKSSDEEQDKCEVQGISVLENTQKSEPHTELKVVSEIPEISGNESVTDSGDDNVQNNINSSMDLETAAVTIQKVFRSFLFKAKSGSFDDATAVDINLLSNDKEKEKNEGLGVHIKDRRSLGISRMDTVLQTVNEEKSLSLSTDDSSTLSSAATIIQAHVRGFLVRNKFNLNKTISSTSLVDSDGPSGHSLEIDSENLKNKTVLNIHIVPETNHFISRDESILTSMDLSLDGSPRSSVNLHPLGYNKSERRKQLKREDAIQSVSPPSNNSGKLSDDIDSIKEVFISDSDSGLELQLDENQSAEKMLMDSPDEQVILRVEAETETKMNDSHNENPSGDTTSDEMDVITPFTPVNGVSNDEENNVDNSSKLLHSGEFHDVVVPTKVSRSDTSVVREFQNVLVYFILWNN